jgi:cell migration-inducing and hyaluronan-binding protein
LFRSSWAIARRGEDRGRALVGPAAGLAALHRGSSAGRPHSGHLHRWSGAGGAGSDGGRQRRAATARPAGRRPLQRGAGQDLLYYGQVNILSGGTLDFEQPKTGSPDINFWASSIVVEANGALTAGITAPYGEPRLSDKQGGFLTIYLYGSNQSVATDGTPVDPMKKQGQGVLCKSPLTRDTGDDPVPCGIPPTVWQNNGGTVLEGCGASATNASSNCIPGLPTAAKDYFYDYAPLYGDGKCANGSDFEVKNGKAVCGGVPAAGEAGYFGYKVLAVSYGGSLILNGYKGVATGLNNQPLNSGNSWLRLAGDLNPGATSLTLAGSPAERWWLPNDNNRDQIVVTTTDYLPNHSEELTVTQVQGDKVTFTPAIKWFHNGTRFPIASNLGTAKGRLEDAGMDPTLVSAGAETRAAVALLTRSIRIVSGGDVVGETFAQAVAAAEKAGKNYYFGGHTVFRQGFKQVQLDGVELADLGQGGKIGHYPIHFHMARQVPPNTFVDDSSVNDSNTRWYVLHDTQGVTLQRDVGWKSIGHGYYLEDGTEADNNFYSDLGIFARAAINNPDNPRKVPGILADNQGPFPAPSVSNPGFPYRSDSEYPTVFWISNGWNNFKGDMAAGAGACGSAYWFVPLENSDMPDVPTASNSANGHMKWDDGSGVFGYAGLQHNPVFAGSSAVESFYGNYATSTMMSLQTTPDAPACAGFIAADAPALNTPTVREIFSFAPHPARKVLPTGGTGPNLAADPFYPHAIGAKKTTQCPMAANQVAGLPTKYDCSPPPKGKIAGPCADGSTFAPNDPNSPEANCAATVIDHFTSSFHWTQGNVSAIWLRPFWYLVTNSVLSDVQQGGLTFVTGGDVTRSSIISGYWGLLRDSILIGHTQPQDAAHRFASDLGPFNEFTKTTDKLECAPLSSDVVPPYCLNAQEGISLPVSDFFLNQRLENIYDGPSYRDSNAYLDVSVSDCEPNGYNGAGGCIYGAKTVSGILKNPAKLAGQQCYLPNAAIAWKQPNGFFYPPAFHANNLYFNQVDIRHFVIDPLFKAFSGSTPATGDFGQAGTYITDPTAVQSVYCLPSGADANLYFNSFTGIDRQTELNDDDGTLTGLSNDVQKTLDPPNPLKQTISVNEDDFFTAPVETAECVSNIGNNTNPANACISPSKTAPTVTAKTSPYDYVSTVIYHTPEGGIWDADCSNPECYGVPLYRQFLAGTKGTDAATSTREWKHWYNNGCNTNRTTTECRWPFIRMSGTALGTRETLTINNGTYYLDTTVPKTIQQSESYNTSNGGQSKNTFVNVFQPDTRIGDRTFVGTYNVFFLYEKTSTRQTYEIYLGKEATGADIKPIQVSLTNLNTITNLGSQPWLLTDTSQVANDGIVSVTVDFSKLTDGTLDVVPANGLCEPHTFCKPSGNKCESALPTTDPLAKQAAAVCSEWAVKDLDCPPKGCYGFSFTIPKTGFVADATLQNPSPHRPAPTVFPDTNLNQGQPTWLAKFLATTVEPDATKGQCHYTTLPGTGCTVPDSFPQ